MEYSNKMIDDLMQKFKPVTGADYNRYRNHVYRVFLNCLLLDSEKNNEEKYAIAAVFHDIGIWTNHTVDYLNPSIEQAKIYLKEINREQWNQEITLMIYWHHKVGKYQGKHERTVENFRKADWVDVSLGLLTYGLDKQQVKQNRKQFPNLGFHRFLIRATAKNFLHHPFNPLPMFKR